MQVSKVTSTSINFTNVVGYHAYILIYVKFRERIIFEEILEKRAGRGESSSDLSFPPSNIVKNAWKHKIWVRGSQVMVKNHFMDTRTI